MPVAPRFMYTRGAPVMLDPTRNMPPHVRIHAPVSATAPRALPRAQVEAVAALVEAQERVAVCDARPLE